MTSIRTRLDVIAVVVGLVVVGGFIPVVTHGYFNDPTPAAHVAPARIHLLPVLTSQPTRIQSVHRHTGWCEGHCAYGSVREKIRTATPRTSRVHRAAQRM